MQYCKTRGHYRQRSRAALPLLEKTYGVPSGFAWLSYFKDPQVMDTGLSTCVEDIFLIIMLLRSVNLKKITCFWLAKFGNASASRENASVYLLLQYNILFPLSRNCRSSASTRGWTALD